MAGFIDEDKYTLLFTNRSTVVSLIIVRAKLLQVSTYTLVRHISSKDLCKNKSN